MYIDTHYTYVNVFKKEENVDNIIKKQDHKAETYWDSVIAKAKPSSSIHSEFTAKLERINMNSKYGSSDFKYKKRTKR